MFKKLMSVCVLSLFALSAWAEPPDQVELDLTAAVARADKAEDEAVAAVKAAHVRALKAKVTANETAVRRLKSRLSTTKDASKREAIEARVAVLEAEAKAMTEESKGDIEVTVGIDQPAPAAAQQPVAQAAGPLAHVAGVWVIGRVYGGKVLDVVVITADGEITTRPKVKVALTGDRNILALSSDGVILKERLVRLSATKMQFAADGERAYTMTRVSPGIPTRESLGKFSGAHQLAVGVDEAHEESLREFIKANPIK